jgi:hypothetical protein
MNMKHIKITNQLQTQTTIEQPLRNNDGIEPFSERPKVEQINGQRSRVGAHDLFSLFTADIIREKTLFTR